MTPEEQLALLRERLKTALRGSLSGPIDKRLSAVKATHEQLKAEGNSDVAEIMYDIELLGDAQKSAAVINRDEEIMAKMQQEAHPPWAMVFGACLIGIVVIAFLFMMIASQFGHPITPDTKAIMVFVVGLVIAGAGAYVGGTTAFKLTQSTAAQVAIAATGGIGGFLATLIVGLLVTKSL